MDGTTSLNDRRDSLYRNDVVLTNQFQTRTVVIERDKNGYGFTVSGDNPVSVQSVKEGGAAEKAGVQSGDVITKVNGVAVCNSNHTEVVQLIKSASYVYLTVLTKTVPNRPTSWTPSAAMPSPSPTSMVHARPLHHPPPQHTRSTERITAPLPVDHHLQLQMDHQRLHTFRLMLEKEQRHLDALRSEYARNNLPRNRTEIQGTERRVRVLQEQLDNMTKGTTDQSPLSSPYQRQHYILGEDSNHTSDIPPPLPARSRSLVTQTSAPTLSQHTIAINPIPPLPPRSQSQNTPFLHPCDDVPPNNITQCLNKSHVTPTNNCASAVPPTSSVHTHHRTKSSPDPIAVQYANSNDFRQRLASSDSMTELNNKRPKTCWEMETSPRPTPPGTPPPPYGSSSPIADDGNANEEDSIPPALAGHDDHEDEAQDDPVPVYEYPVCVQFVPSPCSNMTSPNEMKMPYLHLPIQHNTSGTPPDTSPMRAGSSAGSFHGNRSFHHAHIMSMEEDEFSDQETGHMDDHGPFNSLTKLWKYPAHLSVFMNYILSNSDPSSLLFYLITDLYKEGNAKEMRKWAYEIHSTFLLPGAPVRLKNVDENIAKEVDDVLMNESDKEEILRKVFFKARCKAKEELNDQLADFRVKRTAGLDAMFGATDLNLDESINDRAKEAKIVEGCLVPQLESYAEDIENASDRTAAMASSLATILNKHFGIRTPHATSLVEKCPSFVSKDKSLKTRFMGRNKKQQIIKGHHFVAQQYFSVTYCNQCFLILWGISPQGYQCADCNLNIHRNCVRLLEEQCLGAVSKKEKGNDRISKFMDKIRNSEREPKRKPSQLNLPPQFRRPQEDDCDVDSGDRVLASGGRAERRLQDPLKEGEERTTADGLDNYNEEADSCQQLPKKPQGTAISRSESYKERIHNKRQTRERRKTSDPNLSKTSDVDLDASAQGLSYTTTHSGSSSSSSLSARSLDSPSNSLEMVTTTSAGTRPSTTPETVTSASVSSCTLSQGCAGWDSDIETEQDPPDWTKTVAEEQLMQLSAKEKKRQEVINELFHTEKSHVRALKVLDRLFNKPLQENQLLPPEQLQLLFNNLEEMLDVHGQFNNAMKCIRSETAVVGNIGGMLLTMFDGERGQYFQRSAACFCARQQIALESLRERRRKDQKLNNFLSEAELNPVCRRLQLKDIIPMGMLRLTKYPLLFENLVKYTNPGSEEHASVIRAVERSREILNYVNEAVKYAGDNQRLVNIQRRLDKSAFERADHPLSSEVKTLDLTRHTLIHEGPLTWRTSNRQKQIELHVVLLDDLILLLQRQDEKYVLKLHNINLVSGREDTKLTHSPIFKLGTVLVRDVATDKRAFFLVSTAQVGAQIYELVAGTAQEKDSWFRHIKDTADSYKTREGRHRHPGHPLPPIPLVSPSETENEEVTTVTDKTRESEEGTDVPTASSSSTGGDVESSKEEEAPVPVSQQQSPPIPGETDNDSIAKKTGDGNGVSGEASSQQQQQRMQRVDILRITEGSPLIQPSEVVVSQGAVLTAEPVLTPIEKLRRKDQVIRLALEEKQRIVADILHVPHEEFENIAEIAGEPDADKEAKELVLAAMLQVKRLDTVLNESLHVTEEEAISAGSETTIGSSPRPPRKSSRMPGPPGHLLLDISSSLNLQLTHLLNIINERDEERERLRRELQRSREQVHLLHDLKRHHPTSELSTSANTASPDSQSPSNTSITHSRPNSFVSVASDVQNNPQESEEETGSVKSSISHTANDLNQTNETVVPLDQTVKGEFVDPAGGNQQKEVSLSEEESVEETNEGHTSVDLVSSQENCESLA